jgi:hypothetical protein
LRRGGRADGFIREGKIIDVQPVTMLDDHR